MNIKDTSLIYKFQRDSIVSEGECWIPHNLCPYMRRFIRLIIASFIMGFAVIIGGVGTIAAPLYLWLGDLTVGLGGYFRLYVGFGTTVWVIAVATGIIWVFNRIFSRKYASRRAMNMFTIKYVVEPTKRVIKRNIFVQWYKAIHDKICPTLNFVSTK